MKYLRNPITNQVQACPSLYAKRLLRYQWEEVTRKEWEEYKQAQVQASMARHMKAARPKLGLFH